MRRRAGSRERSSRLERGATLVEYALGTAVVLVAGMVAFNFLSNSADTQAKAQANCISTRPPPASCVRTPVPASTTTTPPGSTSSTSSTTTTPTSPPPSSTTTTTAPPPVATVTQGTATVVSNGDGTWAASAPITITDPGGNPVAGAIITARMLIEGQPFNFGCTTDAAGTCAIVIDPIPDTTGGGVLAVTSIADSNPPAPPPPYPSWNLAKP